MILECSVSEKNYDDFPCNQVELTSINIVASEVMKVVAQVVLAPLEL